MLLLLVVAVVDGAVEQAAEVGEGRLAFGALWLCCCCCCRLIVVVVVGSGAARFSLGLLCELTQQVGQVVALHLLLGSLSRVTVVVVVVVVVVFVAVFLVFRARADTLLVVKSSSSNSNAAWKNERRRTTLLLLLLLLSIVVHVEQVVMIGGNGVGARLLAALGPRRIIRIGGCVFDLNVGHVVGGGVLLERIEQLTDDRLGLVAPATATATAATPGCRVHVVVVALLCVCVCVCVCMMNAG